MIRSQIATILAAQPGPALVLDAGGAVEAANAAAHALLGYPEGGLAGVPIEALAPEGTAGALARSCDGTAIEVELAAGELPDGRVLLTLRDATLERRRTRQLADAESIAQLGVWDWHVPTNVVTWSDQMYRMFGYEPGAIAPTYEAWLEGIHPEDRQFCHEAVMEAFEERRGYEFRHRVVHPNGDIVHLHCRGEIALDERGEPLRVAGASQDLTTEMRRRAMLEAILDGAGEGICGLDADGRVTFANPAAARMSGRSIDELVGMSIDDLLVVESKDRDAVLVRPIATTLPVGHLRTPLAEGAGEVVTFNDATERRRYESQLRFLADHDGLTGLCNRRRFELEINAQESYASRYGGTFSLLLLDIDNFKDVNDTRGHRTGDDLICSIARVLSERVRSADVLARLGGDEFAVLLPATDALGAQGLAEELRAAVHAHSLVASGHRLRVTASIGVAVHDGSAGAAERLLADADAAMYDAKDAGRNRVALAQAEHGRSRMEERFTWVTRLRRALDDDDFIVHAQPIHDIASGEVCQYELLLRMRGEDGGIVPPGAFLPVAERHGMIRELDHWVVRRAIEIAAAQRDGGRATRLEVNLSPRSLGDPELPRLVAAELERTGADPGQLVFEVTETAAIDSMHDAQALVANLTALGCSFALDDFGAGFSSFTYLKHLPVQYVKINGEFVRSITRNKTDQLVVQALVSVCRGLGRRTIAEFVEDPETAELLRSYGVDLLQGYHIGRPGPLADVLPAPTASRSARRRSSAVA